jgi:hypothetical protein
MQVSKNRSFPRTRWVAKLPPEYVIIVHLRDARRIEAEFFEMLARDVPEWLRTQILAVVVDVAPPPKSDAAIDCRLSQPNCECPPIIITHRCRANVGAPAGFGRPFAKIGHRHPLHLSRCCLQQTSRYAASGQNRTTQTRTSVYPDCVSNLASTWRCRSASSSNQVRNANNAASFSRTGRYCRNQASRVCAAVGNGATSRPAVNASLT